MGDRNIEERAMVIDAHDASCLAIRRLQNPVAP